MVGAARRVLGEQAPDHLAAGTSRAPPRAVQEQVAGQVRAGPPGTSVRSGRRSRSSASPSRRRGARRRRRAGAPACPRARATGASRAARGRARRRGGRGAASAARASAPSTPGRPSGAGRRAGTCRRRAAAGPRALRTGEGKCAALATCRSSIQSSRRSEAGKTVHQPLVAVRRRQGRRLEEPRGAKRGRARLPAGRGKGASCARGRAQERRRHARGPAGQADRRVALVACERLVAAVPGEGDGHVPSRGFATIRNCGSAASSPSGSSNASARRGSVLGRVRLEHDAPRARVP